MRANLAVLASFLGLASALPADAEAVDKRQTVPTIYLCGDSTTAKGGGGGGTEGWGPYLQYSFSTSKAKVDNRAIGGRRVTMSLIGVAETVLTYPAYLKNAAKKFNAKGAKVIISAATPNNVWETGTYKWGYDRFFYYAWLAVEQLGGPSKGYYFVPHGEYAAQAMKNLGASTVNANYPNDHTHTAPFLADAMHKAFVLGLRCGTSALASLAKNTTASLTSTYLGPCIDNYNSTVHALLR
ncbi:rhamnogalacturonan acetylesterase RhgT [Colletotrichum spaethianum]|uniref:Rhamnogalacturonan acetylesterase RhgT n=1 Tax=Colletotrichum spaethianum TaxID=700344 RepID=A0AA37P9K4_9PEZI|nr:rhamnogalacturonan acetylesterase RhgT [Colletotrichum spaethianum]GKT48157.1 rhamnogalacturonan acetylesterase RhgT [Colletotrichum spaethianum]